jgi:hypothetical protein
VVGTANEYSNYRESNGDKYCFVDGSAIDVKRATNSSGVKRATRANAANSTIWWEGRLDKKKESDSTS